MSHQKQVNVTDSVKMSANPETKPHLTTVEITKDSSSTSSKRGTYFKSYNMLVLLVFLQNYKYQLIHQRLAYYDTCSFIENKAEIDLEQTTHMVNVSEGNTTDSFKGSTEKTKSEVKSTTIKSKNINLNHHMKITMLTTTVTTL